jgi:hypothetical protein
MKTLPGKSKNISLSNVLEPTFPSLFLFFTISFQIKSFPSRRSNNPQTVPYHTVLNVCSKISNQLLHITEKKRGTIILGDIMLHRNLERT